MDLLLSESDGQFAQDDVQRRLQIRERELTDFVENATVGLHWVTAEGIIKWANQTEMRLLGYTPDEYIGQPITKFHADSNVINEILCRLTRNEELHEYPARLRCKDGTIKHVLINSNVYWEGEKFIHTRCFTRDVTAQRAAEATLAEKQRILQLRVEISRALTSNQNFERILQECSEAFVAHLNMAFARIWTLNESLQTLELNASAGMYTHKNGPHARVKVGDFKIGRIASNKQPHLSNTVTTDPEVGDRDWAIREGMIGFAGYPLIVENRVLGVVAMFSRSVIGEAILEELAPIADAIAQFVRRRRVEADLVAQNEWLRVTLSSIGDAVVATDDAGNITFINPVAEKLTGWTAYEARGQSIDQVFKIVHEETREPAKNPIRNVLADGKIVFLANHTVLISKSGIETPIEDSAAPIRDAHGRLIGVVMVFRDVTRERESERERVGLLEREQAARLDAEHANSAKDQFFATLSHELRSPLTPILGWTRLIMRGDLDPESQANGLKVIHRNAKVQARLIDDILDISRIITGKLSLNMHPLDFNRAIEAAIDVVRVSADAKHIHLSYKAAIDDIRVNGDPDRLQQVLWNLLTNAIKFTPERGSIHIACSKSPDGVQLKITDTGVGLKAEFIPRIFERFSQADSSSVKVHKGLGIGLALVKSLVDLHGGRVYVESPGVGLGSTFTVELPLAAPMESNLLDKNLGGTGRILASVFQQKKILIVEDDQDCRDYIAWIFKRHGATVTACGSTAEALANYRLARPDLLISDLGMPGEDGYTLMVKIREMEPSPTHHTPAIALTAFVQDADRRRCEESGFQLHLAKPVDVDLLEQAASALLTGHYSPKAI